MTAKMQLFACLLYYCYFYSSLSQAKHLQVDKICLLKSLRKQETKTIYKHSGVQQLQISVQETSKAQSSLTSYCHQQKVQSCWRTQRKRNTHTHTFHPVFRWCLDTLAGTQERLKSKQFQHDATNFRITNVSQGLNISVVHIFFLLSLAAQEISCFPQWPTPPREWQILLTFTLSKFLIWHFPLSYTIYDPFSIGFFLLMYSCVLTSHYKTNKQKNCLISHLPETIAPFLCFIHLEK